MVRAISVCVIHSYLAFVGPKTARSLNICTPLETSKGPKAKSAKNFILKAQFFALIFAQEAAGAGYNFAGLYQHKMKESGNDATGGGSYTDYDIIRNADSVLYGPTVFVRANW
jgi:hypothetical protein